MQSLHSQRKKSKKIIIGVLVMLLVAGIGAWSLYALRIGPFDDSVFNENNSAAEEKNSQKDTETTDEDTPTETTDSAKNPPTTADEDNAHTSDERLVITSTGVNGTNFSVRTLINEITQSGTCTLSMTSSNGKAYTTSAGVQPTASTSTCKGFDVPLGSLESGNWKVTVTYTNNGSTVTASKDVVINA